MIQILNPVTGERRYIRASSDETDLFRRRDPFWYGFGYDQSSDDYKVVRILKSSDVEIYSVRAKSCRVIRLQFTNQGCQMNGVFACGALHWINQLNLLVLDLGSETFRRVPLPDFEESCTISLGVVDYGLSLCVSALYEESQLVGLWVVREYEGKDSWCRIHTVELGSVERNHVSSIEVVGCSRSSGSGGRFLLLLNDWQLCWYDPLIGLVVKAVEMNDVIPDEQNVGIEAFYCLESLVKILP